MKIWWKALLLCILAAIAGALFSSVSYVPSYTSYTTFVVSNKSTGGESDANSLTISDISAATALTNTFKYILLSDEALYAVIRTYALDMSIDRLKACVSISPILNTNVLEMSVSTNDAEMSKNIADKIIEYYPDVLDRTLKSASLEVLNPPRSAQEADSYSGHIAYPLLGFVLACFITIIYVYLRLVLHDTVKTVSDISDRLGLTVLAAIPRVKSLIQRKSRLLMTDKANGFSYMESYKALRTKVETIAEKKGYKTYIITSALENEGKTTAAVNLSVALAANGRRVLLIDADLKSPSVLALLDRVPGLPIPGLDRVLRGEASLESAVMHVKGLGIYVLPNINEVLDSSELLSSLRMKDLITRASQQYDFVIIDTPPAGILTDAAVLTSYADAVLLALRQDYASSRTVDSVVRSLSENKAEFIGCIFSIVDGRIMENGGYGYSRYQKYGRYAKQSGGMTNKIDAVRRIIGR
jgi:receptor protein-tyrosine kinase